jgi:hypothetical protein
LQLSAQDNMVKYPTLAVTDMFFCGSCLYGVMNLQVLECTFAILAIDDIALGVCKYLVMCQSASPTASLGLTIVAAATAAGAYVCSMRPL